MDEIDYKLNTRNSVLVVNAIEKLITAVKSKFTLTDRKKFVLENEELKYLRERCCSKETVVSLTSCQGLLDLVESGVLETGHTMSTIISLLPSSHNYSALISTMAGLLILDLRSRLAPGKKYVCPFGLKSPQHPFLTVLERNVDAADDVFTQMHALCTHPDFDVKSNSIELLRPVFLRICNEGGGWRLLVDAGERGEAVLLEALCWIQMNDTKSGKSALTAFTAITEMVVHRRQTDYAVALLPLLARHSYQMIVLGRDPRATYNLIEQLISLDIPEVSEVAGLTLALLADNLLVSSALHLQDLFTLCLNIISKYSGSSLVIGTFVAFTLQWVYLPSTLTKNALKVATKIIEIYRENKMSKTKNLNDLQSNKIFNTLIYTNRCIYTKFKFLQTYEQMSESPEKLSEWFSAIESTDNSFKLNLVPFLCGLLIGSDKSDISLKVLKVLLQLVDMKKDLNVTLLPILLYKIANDSSPILKLECLKAVPLMSKSKENVPIIVAFLSKLKSRCLTVGDGMGLDGRWMCEVCVKGMENVPIIVAFLTKLKSSRSVPTSLLILLFSWLVEIQVRCFSYLHTLLENVPIIVAFLTKLKSSRSVPTSLLILLFSRLVEIQVRCFPYLQELLVDNGRHDENRWEIDVAKAVAVKRICEVRPSQGLDLVSVISSILNRCSDGAGSVATSHAIEALRCLWENGLVAPPSTWQALEPKLAKDQRVRVQASICNLLSIVPKLRVLTPEYSNLLNVAATLLWHYISESDEPTLLKHACRALSNYSLDMYGLKHVPENVNYLTPEYSNLLNVAATLLWHYIAESDDPTLLKHACRAVANYLLDMYALKHVPEIYRRTVKLPASFCKTPEEAERDPADVLDYIPCEIWPEVYRNTSVNGLPYVRELVSKLIEAEVRGYRSGVYQVEARQVSLPAYSVVRGLADFVRKQATSPSYDCPETVLLEMLTTLSQEYPKPLPPFDLYYLHDLYHRGNLWKLPCLVLAGRQAVTAQSAKRFVDNFLVSIEPEKMEESDIMLLFEILPILCRTMPPNSLRTPVEKCLTHSFNKSQSIKYKDLKPEEVKEVMFVKQIEVFGLCLKSEKIHEANRSLLVQVLDSYLYVIDEDNVSYPSFCVACSFIPCSMLQEVAAFRVRCMSRVAACRCDNKLVGLHDIVEMAAGCRNEQEYTISSLYPVFKESKPGVETLNWLLQLMARTQVAFNENEEDVSKLFLWDIFTMSIVAISGYWWLDPETPCKRDNMYALFPGAVSLLFGDLWTEEASKVLECLCHTRNIHPEKIAAISCNRAVSAMKEHPYFMKSLWTKAMSYRVCE